MKVCLQAGHGGRTSGATGAPGEKAWTTTIVPKIAQRLRDKGIEVKETGADDYINDKAVTQTDWDLFLSVHYDADVYNDRGGFVDYPEPSTDYAHSESKRIKEVIENRFFARTGIPNKNRSNANTRYYYMWKFMSAKTPCVLIEAGVGYRKPEDYDTLRNYDLIANTLADAIAEALGVGGGDEFGNMVKKSTQYDCVVKEVLGITDRQPHDVPCSEVKARFDKLQSDLNHCQSIISNPLTIEITHNGTKNTMGWFLTEWANRVEQVERLKAEKEQLQVRLDAYIKDDSADAQTIKDMQAKIDEMGKTIGGLEQSKMQASAVIKGLQDDLKACQSQTSEPVECPEIYNLTMGQLFKLIFTKIGLLKVKDVLGRSQDV